jgi:DNA-directed RNA polymerase specialized sigma24 family protein
VPSARDELAGAAVRVATKVTTRFRRIPADEQAALANQVAARVVEAVERGNVESGKEDGYTHTCARHAACDWLRARQREGTAEPILDNAAYDEEVAIEERLDQKRAVRLLERVLIHREGTLAASYRDVLVQIFVTGRTVEQIVDDELGRGTAPDADPQGNRARVRNRVDVLLKRARAALRRAMGELASQTGDRS